MFSSKVSLKYEGQDSSEGRVDFYDVSQALMGFERSLALTSHLILNGEIIVQAPALKNCRIVLEPPTRGSWEIFAIILGGLFAAGSVSKDSVVGHLICSAYDYIVKQTLGFNVDFDKTLGQQIEEAKKIAPELPRLTEDRFDSLIEKTEKALSDIHRPIVRSETASKATIRSHEKTTFRILGVPFTTKTYEHVSVTEQTDSTEIFIGRVSSYNVNTFKGRVFSEEEGRPVPFVLSDDCRDRRTVKKITNSLDLNAQYRNDERANVKFTAYKNYSASHVLKGYFIVHIE